MRTIHSDWLSRLAKRGQPSSTASWIDLGPQDIRLPRPALLALAARHLARADVDCLVDRMFADGRVRRDAQLDFYGLFGARSYRSIDLEDPIAAHKLDLNSPVPDSVGPFDVVTNFGTAEHVYNIGQVFVSIHDRLNLGGVSLRVCPAFAFVNHGLYNVHPNLYLERARQNGCELVDFYYVDNMHVREMLRSGGAAPFDFDGLPIKPGDMESTQNFMTKVVARYFENLRSAETRDVLLRLSPDKSWTARRLFPSTDFHICFLFISPSSPCASFGPAAAALSRRSRTWPASIRWRQAGVRPRERNEVFRRQRRTQRSSSSCADGRTCGHPDGTA